MDYNNYHRIRSIIEYLPNLSDLRVEKLIPNKVIFPTIKKGGKLGSNKLAKKIGYSQYGLLMEDIFSHALSGESIELYIEALKHMYPDCNISYNQFEDIINFYRNVFHNKPVKLQVELISTPIIGHPDVVTDDTVYDIKTTCLFNKMRVSTTYQLLAYYCLTQKLGYDNIKNIAVILPAQLKVVTVNMSDWNWEPFYNKLVNCITNKTNRQGLYKMPQLECLEFQSLYRTIVGKTIQKTYLFNDLGHNKPLQFYVHGNASANVEIDKSFQNKVKNLTSKTSTYIHASYCFNLSNPYGNFSKDTDDDLEAWTWKNMQSLLTTAEYMGISGVVIHVGKRGKDKKGKYKMTTDIAISNMMESVIRIAEYATPSCPLLIETPAAEDGEILATPEELASFYLSIDDELKYNVAICVDTCHVFAAGYDPMEYINTLEEFEVPIRLIHYNDSKMEKGSKHDRHASIGKGYIGLKPMANVLNYSVKKGISLVTE